MAKRNIRSAWFSLWTITLILSACGSGDLKVPSSGGEATKAVATVATDDIEKPQLKLGFIKLTDMAPLAIAKELGYFEEEGLYVSIEAQSNWKNVLDRVIDGELDGSHMLAGQPIAAGAGFGRQANLVTPFSMDLNGNGITVSNTIWDAMKPNVPLGDDGKPLHPIKADAIKASG